jgi:hypothetical protein
LYNGCRSEFWRQSLSGQNRIEITVTIPWRKNAQEFVQGACTHMPEATHEQVKLMLDLFDLRREARLRQAREWFTANFQAANAEEMSKKYPMGSEGSVNMRMVVTYWDMVANIANRGLLHEELFFETSGEQWFVWERIKPLASAMREMFKNSHAWEALEEHCRRLEAWRERRAPGSSAAMRQMMQQMMQAQAGNKPSA